MSDNLVEWAIPGFKGGWYFCTTEGIGKGLVSGCFALQHFMLGTMYSQIKTAVPAMLEGRLEEPKPRWKVLLQWILFFLNVTSPFVIIILETGRKWSSLLNQDPPHEGCSSKYSADIWRELLGVFQNVNLILQICSGVWLVLSVLSIR